MKKEYVNAQLEIILIFDCDVIRTSPSDTEGDMPGFGEDYFVQN